MNIQVKKMCKARYVVEGCGAPMPSLLPLSQNLHMFTNPEAL